MNYEYMSISSCYFNRLKIDRTMTAVTPVQLQPNRKRSYKRCHAVLEIDAKYIPIRPIGKGAYGLVCSSINRETNEVVAIKKITNVFGDRVRALRTLRELMLLRCIKRENVIALKDVMITANRSAFHDVYMVYELMDTDLHHIIPSPQPLTNDHCNCLGD